MIIQEEIGNGLVKTYSDKGMLIKGGVPEGLYVSPSVFRYPHRQIRRELFAENEKEIRSLLRSATAIRDCFRGFSRPAPLPRLFLRGTEL